MLKNLIKSSNFSPEVIDFLAKTSESNVQETIKKVSIVPKSDSCADPGDFLIFRYQLGSGQGSRRFRIVLMVQPITKDPATGNKLLTGFRVPIGGDTDSDQDYTPDSLTNLYINKALDVENYRTYRLNKIYGPLYRLKAPEKQPSEVN